MLTRCKINTILHENGFDLEDYKAIKIFYQDYAQLTPSSKEAETNAIFDIKSMNPIFDCGWNADNAYKFIEQYKSTTKAERKATGYPASNAKISKANRTNYLWQKIISRNQTTEEKIIALFKHRTNMGHFRDITISLDNNKNGLYTITYIDIKKNKTLYSFTYPLIKIYQDLLFFK